ncbi:MAG: tetratricopeptide repeat protein [Caldilineaceae bacterium]|nr:tetratricopeptide repeat protein [Caldilineaceae bacterium]
METQQQPAGAPFSLRELPASFWYTVTISTGLSLVIILVMVVLGYRDGLRRGEAQTRQQIAILLQRASDMLDAGMHEEARAVYTGILEFDPQNDAARSAISAVDAIDSSETVPEAVVEPTATDLEWARAQALYEEGRWQEAIQRFSLVQSMQPEYRREELQKNLFVAHVELARAAIVEGNLEEAVQLFDSALELDPNNLQVQEERYMIAHYVDVKTYWGANWAHVIRLLEDLYRIDPGYRDVQFLLQRAHVYLGEGFAREENWCAAAAEYTSAIAVLDWLELRPRRDELAASCRNGGNG